MIRMSRSVSIFSLVVVMTVTVLATVAVALAQEEPLDEPQNEGGGGRGQEKITICHNDHVITVAKPAWPAHERHGDEELNGDTELENGDTGLENGGTELENPEDACPSEGALPEEPSEDATLTTDATDTATLPAGTISDVATLNVPVGTTGTIEFKLYGPFTTAPGSDACTTPIEGAGSTKPVTAFDPANPTFTSDPYTPTEAGIYNWTATFTPDAGDPSGEIGCGETVEQSVVDSGAPTTSTLTTEATPTAILPAGTISDTATLGTDVPVGTTGTIEFKLYGPFTTAPGSDACTTPIEGAGSTKTVPDDAIPAGSNTYPSDPYTPTEPGIYQWTATFTPDAGDPSGEIGCGETVEQSVVNEASSTTGTEQNMTLAGETGEAANLADPATETTNIEGTTQNGNTTLGTESMDDVLYGGSSANKLLGRHGNDYLDGGQGRDRMVGGKQNDHINGADGKPGDVINGGIGTDYCVGDVGDEIKNCDGNVVNVPLPSEAAAPAEARN
jgi:hypothetical protein